MASSSQLCPVATTDDAHLNAKLSESQPCAADCAHPHHDDTAASDNDSFLGTSPRPRAAKPTGLQLPSQIPNFLINALDGDFTPYSDRSPATSPTETSEDPIDIFTSATSSPTAPTTAIRSRAASIAFHKILKDQAQLLFDVSAAWNQKYNPPPGASCVRSQSTLGETLDPRTRLQSSDFSKSLRTCSVACRDSSSIAAPSERLSLKDGDAPSDVEKWKTEAADEASKRQATVAWVHCLSQAEHLKEADDPVDWTEPEPL